MVQPGQIYGRHLKVVHGTQTASGNAPLISTGTQRCIASAYAADLLRSCRRSILLDTMATGVFLEVTARLPLKRRFATPWPYFRCLVAIAEDLARSKFQESPLQRSGSLILSHKPACPLLLHYKFRVSGSTASVSFLLEI